MRTQLGAKELVELGRSKCPPGKIRRKGFTRSDGTRVRSGCVKDVGAKGKTPKSRRYIKNLKEGAMDGWEHNETASKRHTAIRKDVRQVGCRKTIQRLTAIKVLNKRQSPVASRAANTDMAWLRKQGFCKLKEKGD